MAAVQRLIDVSTVIVCCGSGGVGKTTTAAVLGLEAAMHGRKVVVVTIDPARRLADALGLEVPSCRAATYRPRLGSGVGWRAVGDDARHGGDVRRPGAASRR